MNAKIQATLENLYNILENQDIDKEITLSCQVDKRYTDIVDELSIVKQNGSYSLCYKNDKTRVLSDDYLTLDLGELRYDGKRIHVIEKGNIESDDILNDEAIETLKAKAKNGYNFMIDNDVYRLSQDSKKLIKNGSNKTLILDKKVFFNNEMTKLSIETEECIFSISFVKVTDEIPSEEEIAS